MEMLEKRFGVEIEFTGITRKEAAETIRRTIDSVFPVMTNGDYYDTHSVVARDSRQWKVMYDGSIECQKRNSGRTCYATRNYSCELVTPILTYKEDIETLQKIIRALREAGAFVNDTCGIHVHVDGQGHTPQTLKNFINIMFTRDDMVSKGLNILPRRRRYCKKISYFLVERINKKHLKDLKEVEDIWYTGYYNRTSHYNDSRYHFLNLHAFFHGHHTVELRGFNSSLHAGMVRSYVVLALALNNQALTQSKVIMKDGKVDESCMRKYLHRIGIEDKNVINHLTAGYRNNAACNDQAA